LIQVGPGIFTFNSTADYKWEDFRQHVLSAIKKLYDAHPKAGDLKITNLILRYIDAVDFDYGSQNVFAFLKDKLKPSISLPPNLFEGTGVENQPKNFNWQSSFHCERPKGLIHIRFATGKHRNSPAVVWETTVESNGETVPKMPKEFDKWIDAAHALTDDWFFKMIDGDLKRRFSGE
jgi:uncharacterized protein (TIGR04255 family)